MGSRSKGCSPRVRGGMSAISGRADLTDNAWPFVCSLAIHAALLGILSLPRLQLPSQMDSPFPDVFWLSPLAMPGEVQPAAVLLDNSAFASSQSTVSAVSAPAETHSQSASVDDPPIDVAPTPVEENTVSADSMVAVAVPVNLRTELVKASSPAPPPVKQSPHQPQQLHPKPDPPGMPPEEDPLLVKESGEDLQQRSDETARLKQLVREQEQQVMDEKLADERLAVEKVRKEQVIREQNHKALLEQQEQERLVAVKGRQEQLDREREQRALNEKIARELSVAERAQKEQVIREQNHKALLEQQEQERLVAAKKRQEQVIREREQRTLNEKIARERSAAERAQKEQALREKHNKELEQQEQERLVAAKERQEQRDLEREQRALGEKLAQERRVAEQARKAQEARAKKLLAARMKEEAMRSRKLEAVAREQAAFRLQAAASLTHVSPVRPVAEKQQPEKQFIPMPSTPAGVTVPALKGDLKLVVTGKKLAAITVTFKELVMSRRKPPQEVRVTPLIATPGELVQEIVIERAAAGVYTINAEPDSPAEIACMLKLHEGTSRMATRDLGRQSISGKKVLLKVLMPEGILWEDEKAFTGSIEDSDSVTKFNGQTGLTWKEYK